MDIVGFYLRKFWMIVKNEVLVLPSRIIVFLFCLLLLLLPVFTQDPYLLRILILTSIFAILAASWDLLSGFTGQMNFGHALFFGVGAYTAALLNLHAHLPPWGSIPLGGLGCCSGRSNHRHPVSQAQGHLPGPDHISFSDYLDGNHVFALPGITGGELGISGLERLARSRIVELLYHCSTHVGVMHHHVEDHRFEYRYHFPCHSGGRAGRQIFRHQHHPLQAAGVLSQRVFCRNRRRTLCPFHANCRAFNSGGIDVIPGRYLGGIWRYRNNIWPDRSGVYSISFTRVFPLLAGVPHAHVCDRHIINSAIYAGRPFSVVTRQDRNRMPAM